MIFLRGVNRRTEIDNLRNGDLTEELKIFIVNDRLKDCKQQ